MTVVDARFAKPIDAALMAQLATEHELLVTVEEGVLAGGFGSAVWESLNDGRLDGARIMRVGLPDRYVTHGTPAILHAEVGFTGKRIAERIEAAVGAARRRRHVARRSRMSFRAALVAAGRRWPPRSPAAATLGGCGGDARTAHRAGPRPAPEPGAGS